MAFQLQSILKDTLKQIRQPASNLSVADSTKPHSPEDDLAIRGFIIEKLTSEYRLKDLATTPKIKQALLYFIQTSVVQS